MYRRSRPPAAVPDLTTPSPALGPRGRTVAASIFLFGFGLAPVWFVAYLCVAVSGLAFWYMLFAVPLSLVTFGIASATLARYRSTAGPPEQKLAAAGKRFALLAGIGMAVAVAFWWRDHLKEQERREEQRQVVAFVVNHPQVIARLPGPRRASISSTTGGDQPIRYEVSFWATDPELPARHYSTAIVAVTRTADGAVFTLRCFPTLPAGKRDSRRDDCTQ